MRRVLLIVAVCVLALAGVAYAAVSQGTKHSDWGPAKGTSDGSPDHPNWPMPDDCGDGKHDRHDTRRGDMTGTDGPDHLHGHDGCDFFWAHGGNDVVHLGPEMDAGYGGLGNDRIFGGRGHDHLFGDVAPKRGGGNDYLNTRDGRNERGNVEEIHGGPGFDRCFLDADPDGVKFQSCEKLNGVKNPFGPPSKYYNTADGPHKDMRGKVNRYLNNHGG
jgi:Ca2+-binding RTX toxin-like protein